MNPVYNPYKSLLIINWQALLFLLKLLSHFNCRFTKMESGKLKLLFVCTINRMRSATAHKIFQDDNRFEVRSAGTDSLATTVLSSDLLDWADAIIVMEKIHRNRIREKFPKHYERKKIVCL